jgi:hypothetical protein
MRRTWVFAVSLSLIACKKEHGPGEPGQGGNEGSANAPAKQTGVDMAMGKNPEGCNSDFAQDLAADATLTEKCSPYTVKHGLTFDGFTVTLEPGVELRFADGTELSVGYGSRGKLVAKGTPDKPVRFTALDHKEPGSWKGITLASNAQGSVLENVVIEFAGPAGGDALEVKAGDVTLKNVKLSGAKADGVKVLSEEPVAVIDGLDLLGMPADHVLQLPWTSARALTANNKLPANAVIDLEPAQVEADLSVPNPGVPYRTHGETDVHGKNGKTAVLTLEAGVTVQMAEDAELDFGYEADRPAGLKAVGTADKPIRFVRFGDDQKTTPFKGLFFYDGARGPELDYVTFENGGRPEDATLRFSEVRALGKITHSTFSGSHGAGVLVKSAKEGFAAFDNNAFKGNAQGAIGIPAELAGGIGPSNTFDDTWVEVRGDVHKDTAWAALGCAYRVLGDVTAEGGEAGRSATLTIAPGAKLVFGEGAGLYAGYTNPGHLVIGGAGKPVAMSVVQGSWKGIEAYEKGELKLENATVDGVADDQAPVRVDKGATGEVKNVTFKTKLGLRNCSDKVKSSGNKGAKDSSEGC